MASKIRWSKKDLEEFAKLRKNYNAKIERLRKKDPSLEIYLPAPLKKTDIYSRADLNRAKKRASMFIERGSEAKVKFHGESVPSFFKKDIQYIQKVENARRARARKEFTPERGISNMAEEAAFQPWKIEGVKTSEELIRHKQRLDHQLYDSSKREKMVLYKDNYLRALKQQLGSLAGPIVELIQDMSPEDFVSAMKKDYELTIGFTYDYIDALLKAERLFNRWFEFRRGKSPKVYTKREQAAQLAAAYEDVSELDWSDITDRSRPVRKDIAALGRIGRKK